MAKQLSSYTVQEGLLHLLMKVIKKIHALIYWVKECDNYGVEVSAEKWNEDTLDEVIKTEQVIQALKYYKSILSVK
jgi:hypothetical protein